MPESAKQNERLEPLVGEWNVAMVMPGEEAPEELPDIGARTIREMQQVEMVYAPAVQTEGKSWQRGR